MRRKYFTAFLLLFALLLPLVPPSQGAAPAEFRGLWVASTLNLDYPSQSGLSAEALKAEALTILDDALRWGFTAVVLQVRPEGDALYPSALFPWSAVLTGTQGLAPPDGFDPLAYWVEQAHARGLELHAWVNPFRAARQAAQADALAPNHPVKRHPEFAVTHSDGSIYLNPGLPAVRTLVVDGVLEILRNYAVDGIQYDDYFYPAAGDFNDAAAFVTYGAGYSRKADWRRDNINALIRDTYAAVKAEGRVFGVSPPGIWANRSGANPEGSDTAGFESYSQSFADSRLWVRNGWVDYIAPQIYWEFGHKKADFAAAADWWADTVKGTGVKLYIGHAAYRAGEGGAWAGTSELKRQIAFGRENSEVSGALHFRYAYIAKNAALQELFRDVYAREPSPADSAVMEEPSPRLSVGRPAENLTVSEKTFYIMGAGDPDTPVTCNDEIITERTETGLFSFAVTLQKGKNTFTFKQGGQTVTRVITYSTGGAAAPVKMDKLEILSPFPQSPEESGLAGETVTLKCQAPIGAVVTVRLGGEVLPMEPLSKTGPKGLYRTTYSVKYTLPEIPGDGRVCPVGTPLYSAELDGQTVLARAMGTVSVTTRGAGRTAAAVRDFAFTYPGAATAGGSNGELGRGQMDAVTGVSGDWVRLSAGFWVQKSDVRVTNERPYGGGEISAVTVAAGGKWETLTFETGRPGASFAVLDGQTFTLDIAGIGAAAEPDVSGSELLDSVRAEITDTGARYILTLKDGVRLEGWLTEAVPDGLSLRLKRPLRIKAGDKPLSGFSILLDPGHGGSDMGAIGPYSDAFTEKFINLHAALKLQKELEALGAEVHLTRTEDTRTELYDRAALSRKLLPDLYISLHCNSIGYDQNPSGVRGLSTWYRQALSAPFSQSLYEYAQAALGTKKRGSTQANLYICRQNWSPSVVVEQAFICNPEDYEWMSRDQNQSLLARVLAGAVLNYFKA